MKGGKAIEGRVGSKAGCICSDDFIMLYNSGNPTVPFPEGIPQTRHGFPLTLRIQPKPYNPAIQS